MVLSRVRDFSLQLTARPAAFCGLCVIALLYLMAAFAEFVAPYPYDMERREKAFHPPTRIIFRDASGRFTLRPHVRATETVFRNGARRFARGRPYPIRFLSRGPAYRLWNLVPMRVHLFVTDEPAMVYLLGADWNGRDLFSRIVYGSRVSLSIGLIGVGLSFAIGLAVGILSGLAGGAADSLIMRLCEIVMSVPAFFLMLALRAVFPLDMSSLEVYLMIVVIMSLIGWAGFARIVRGMTLSLRGRDYILSARALGAGPLRITFFHILPNVLSFSVVSATLSIPSYILAESALSLLGLGISEPQASWGNLLARAMNFTDMRYHPWILAPGFFIFLSIAAFNLLGDGLRDLLDPKDGAV